VVGSAFPMDHVAAPCDPCSLAYPMSQAHRERSSTMTETVTCTVNDRICRLTLNRPEKLNALNLKVFEEIAGHLDRLEHDSVGCMVLSGAGRSFCAGHDLDDLTSGEESGAAERFENGIVERLATLPFPVVAKVRGHCFTGGLELVLAADIIVAAETTRFADTHAKFDLVPIWGLSQRLPRRIGMASSNREIKKLLGDTDGLSLAAGNAWELHHSPGHGPEFKAMIAARRPQKAGS
jgi:enoyl-CoA hydratase